jgi:hypothetical protein
MKRHLLITSSHLNLRCEWGGVEPMPGDEAPTLPCLQTIYERYSYRRYK